MLDERLALRSLKNILDIVYAVYKVIKASCTFTSFENTLIITRYKTYHIYYSEMDQSAQ